ncbi:hypothetical protein [Tenacibaculum maritimum]|uniref:hypothetical protein n=1 Tax=Tenacibaculum maritimum TaxID=107401 RepID=UPI0012E594DA|nr:hypothetical protein [Tenacibaculum maritimum]CAA0248348.1 conserved hypothetical protein [Tenacibaculum maritimum]
MKSQVWESLYKEIATRITDNIQSIQWVDLWHNQVGFLEEEHAFPTPAVFLSFRTTGVENQGELVQNVDLQIDLYYFYETFLDTYQGAHNETDALEYLNVLTSFHQLFHGYTPEGFNEMWRISFGAVDTGSAGNLYKVSFSCKFMDESAKRQFDQVSPSGIETRDFIQP